MNKTAKKTLTVVCPAYNEEGVIEAFYEELHSVLSGLADLYETRMLFVLDGCSDGTLDILRRIAKLDSSVQILALSSRFGHQMALLAGMDHCDSDAVITMDSDLQHPPSYIAAMLREFERGFDVVLMIREDAPDTGFFKRTTSRMFYRLINLLANISVSENAADFRLISRRVVRVFQTQIRERNQFLRGLINWVGFKRTAIPFRANKRRAGESKYSLWRMARFALDGIVSFSKIPLLAAIAFGFLFAAFGLLLALITVIQYFLDARLVPGWATLVIVTAIFSGVQLLFLGVMGAYIGAIFDEVKARPHYIVEEMVNLNEEREDCRIR